jgi:hypothetical protein
MGSAREFVLRGSLADGAHVLRVTFPDGSAARISVTAESTRITERAGTYRIEIRSGATGGYQATTSASAHQLGRLERPDIWTLWPTATTRPFSATSRA